MSNGSVLYPGSDIIYAGWITFRQSNCVGERKRFALATKRLQGIFAEYRLGHCRFHQISSDPRAAGDLGHMQASGRTNCTSGRWHRTGERLRLVWRRSKDNSRGRDHRWRKHVARCQSRPSRLIRASSTLELDFVVGPRTHQTWNDKRKYSRFVIFITNHLL
jgi:hypothetical protein